MSQIEKLSEKIVFKKLNQHNAQCAVKVFEEIDSTNLEAKRMAKDMGDGSVLLLAESQTAGKGRMGRRFYSPQSTGLYMSYMYTPKTEFSDSVTVTAATAVAVVKAIESFTELDPKIKWVNDIYINGKKVCGILTEAVTGEKVKIIVGIGINITTEHFPEEVSSIAASLNKPIDRNLLAVEVIKNLQRLIDELPQRTFLDCYREKSCVLGHNITFSKNGESTVGKAIDIDRDGGLVVETESGNVTLNTGEISVRLEK